MHMCVCDKHPPQDSMCRSSAARSPATCTRPHASSGCRGSGVIRVAWQRLGRTHRRLLLPYVHDMHPSMPTHHDSCTHIAAWPYHRHVVACCKWHVHVSHAKARLFVTTGSPVQPHSSAGLEGLDVHFRWVVVPPVIFEHVGFAVDANTAVGFCDQFGLDVPDIVQPFVCATPYISMCV